MKHRHLACGGQPLWNPCRPAKFGRQMGEARDASRLYDTDHPLPGSLPRVSPCRLAAGKMLPEVAVPVPETLREHNPQLFEHLLGRQHRAGRQRFETRRFSDRKPA